MNNKEALDHAIESLNTISEKLNTALISIFGPDADWENHVGKDQCPYQSSPTVDALQDVWAAREESNSSIAWIEDHIEP